MVDDVSRGDVCESPHGEWVVARDAAAVPRIAGQVRKELKCGRAHRVEFVKVGVPWTIFGSGVADGDTLIEAGKR